MPDDKIVPLRMPSNHPADRALEIRYQIQLLEAELARLRAHLLAHPEDCDGAHAVVGFRYGERTTFDRKRLLEFFGRERLAPFMRKIKVTTMVTIDKAKER